MPGPALHDLEPLPLRRGLPISVAGMAGLGLGIALTVRADLGLGPWDVLHQGIADRLGIGIGVAGMAVGLVVLLASLPLGARIGLVTPINVVVVGLVIDGVLAVLPDVANPVARWALLLGGVVVGGSGTALYLVPKLGAGPRDGLMTAIAAHGGSVRVVRTAIELGALALGALLGGSVGVGTVVWALAIGPVVHQGLEVFPRLVRPQPPAVGPAPA